MRTATGPRLTRRSSARPAARSAHWWTLNVVMAASKAPVAKGSASAVAATTGAAPGGRWARIVADGSTATTRRSVGS